MSKPKNRSKNLVVFVAVSVLPVCMTCPGFGSVINVDFNDPTHPGNSTTYTGTAVAPGSGTFWNGLNVNGGSATSGALKASDGTTLTTITVSLAGYTDSYAFGTPALAPALFEDYAYNDVSSRTSHFTISGLVNGQLYDLYLYSQNSTAGNSSTLFTIGATGHTAANAGNLSTYVQGENYVLFAGLTPSSGGISGTFFDNNLGVTGGDTFNGLQLVELPKPATASLLLAFTAPLALRRRR